MAGLELTAPRLLLLSGCLRLHGEQMGKGRESVPGRAGLGWGVHRGLPSHCPALIKWEHGCHEEMGC